MTPDPVELYSANTAEEFTAYLEAVRQEAAEISRLTHRKSLGKRRYNFPILVKMKCCKRLSPKCTKVVYRSLYRTDAVCFPCKMAQQTNWYQANK